MLRLEAPDEKYLDSYRAAAVELGQPEISDEEFRSLLLRLRQAAEGRDLKPGYVAASVFWMIDQDGYAGRVSIRHVLTDALREFGGHIGYQVRPSKQGRGYASEGLRLALGHARNFGLRHLVLTCDTANVASRRVIEKNGGVLEGTGLRADNGEPFLRFTITLE